MSDKLTCRFCEETFQKGWDSKEGTSGMDRLIIHVRKNHSGEWARVKRYSVGTTAVKEAQLVNMLGAYSHTMDK